MSSLANSDVFKDPEGFFDFCYFQYSNKDFDYY